MDKLFMNASRLWTKSITDFAGIIAIARLRTLIDNGEITNEIVKDGINNAIAESELGTAFEDFIDGIQ